MKSNHNFKPFVKCRTVNAFYVMRMFFYISVLCATKRKNIPLKKRKSINIECMYSMYSM